MMSLTEANLLDVVRKQFNYKRRAYLSFFTTLMIAQLVALLFSFGASGMMGAHTGTVFLEVRYVSGSIIIVFTILWAFITSISITTKQYKESDFAFVSNRLSSNLSNILFLFLATSIGALSAMLLSLVQKVIIYYWHGPASIIGQFITPTELWIGMLATFLYILLFSAIGYFAGTLAQLSKLFVVLIPATFFGMIYLGVTNDGQSNRVITFFGEESSLAMLALKIILISGTLYLISIVISNRLEVKK